MSAGGIGDWNLVFSPHRSGSLRNSSYFLGTLIMLGVKMSEINEGPKNINMYLVCIRTNKIKVVFLVKERIKNFENTV